VKQQCQREHRKSDDQIILETESEAKVVKPVKVEESGEVMQTSQADEVFR
jgi:hypothetical protein